MTIRRVDTSHFRWSASARVVQPVASGIQAGAVSMGPRATSDPRLASVNGLADRVRNAQLWAELRDAMRAGALGGPADDVFRFLGGVERVSPGGGARGGYLGGLSGGSLADILTSALGSGREPIGQRRGEGAGYRDRDPGGIGVDPLGLVSFDQKYTMRGPSAPGRTMRPSRGGRTLAIDHAGRRAKAALNKPGAA